MEKRKLQKLWFEFGNIPIDINDCIESDFYIWEKGTGRFIIWDWFDDKLPYGIAEWLD